MFKHLPELVPKIMNIALVDSTATSLLDDRNDVVQGTNRLDGMWLVA